MPPTRCYFRWSLPLACLLVLTGAPLVVAQQALQVHTDFPGGAAAVVRVDAKENLIQFKIPPHPNGGWASWWYFKVTGIQPGDTLRLQQLSGIARPRQAVYSLDGKTWHFTPSALTVKMEGTEVTTFTQKIDGKEAWFAWYVPFVPRDAEAVIDRAVQQCEFAKKFELCQSEDGISVPGIRFHEPGASDDERFGVWIQARQHAWEVGGSWTAAGLIDWLASDDPRAQALRRKAAVSIVPIMDVDSVQKGLGGKNQKPHDHNRDWSDMPVWKAVQSAMSQTKGLDKQGKLDVLLDLHDPGWSGAFDFWCHAYQVMTPTRRRNTDRFMAACKEEVVGLLRCNGKVIVRYPLTTPTAGIWACTATRDHVVGGTFEIGVGPPAGYQGGPVDYHLLAGKQLGLALEKYLQAGIRQIEK
ncbi:MAG: M14-type cytosolic carboxypeptidase [Gemmataceae bacterium]